MCRLVLNGSASQKWNESHTWLTDMINISIEIFKLLLNEISQIENKNKNSFIIIHVDALLTFIFMHLVDACNLHCIQVTVFLQLLSLGIEPMILALLAPCSTIWATGKRSLSHFSLKARLMRTGAATENVECRCWGVLDQWQWEPGN